jgi:hypothetical protein
VMVIVGLAASGALSPFWASLCPFVYSALNVTMYLGNDYGVSVTAAVKSWMMVYPAIVLYLLRGRNDLDVAAQVSIASMAAGVVLGLLLLSHGVRGDAQAHRFSWVDWGV